MTARTEAQDELLALRHKPLHLLRYLDENSGLPGPRANLTLVDAFADVGPEEIVLQLAGSPDEFRRLCAAAALGRLRLERPDDPELDDRMLRAARDDSWRVREGAAMALQRIGDARPELLRDIVEQWLADPSPRVVRAAIAGICEPRLLRERQNAAAALAACRAATGLLRLLSPSERRSEEARTLRQALGYCWSVAVAGAPETGLPAFERLRQEAAGDIDVAWIVQENLAKARLRRLITR